MSEVVSFNPDQINQSKLDRKPAKREIKVEDIMENVRMNKEDKNKTIVEQQNKAVAGLLETFVLGGKWDSLQSARDEFKSIQEKALSISFDDKVALEGPDVQELGAIHTGQEIKIDAYDETTGRTLKAEFQLDVVAAKDSKNYGKYKLVAANKDAERLK